jgi:hypothetical protein
MLCMSYVHVSSKQCQTTAHPVLRACAAAGAPWLQHDSCLAAPKQCARSFPASSMTDLRILAPSLRSQSAASQAASQQPGSSQVAAR